MVPNAKHKIALKMVRLAHFNKQCTAFEKFLERLRKIYQNFAGDPKM